MSTREWCDNFEREENRRQERLEKLKEDVTAWREKMAFRDSFITRFSEADARVIEAAADSHKNGIHDKPGSDPFRWAILICIGYDCISRYAAHHNITCGWEDVRDWLKQHKAYIGAHDGDCDCIAMLAGTYNEFVED